MQGGALPSGRLLGAMGNPELQQLPRLLLPESTVCSGAMGRNMNEGFCTPLEALQHQQVVQAALKSASREQLPCPGRKTGVC